MAIAFPESAPSPEAVSVNIGDDLDLDQVVIVALGGNDKGVWSSCQEALEAALDQLRAEGIDVLGRSRWWVSQAWPDPTDPPFLNGIALVRTDLDAQALMRTLSRIEDRFGRHRTTPNAPRTLDLDLIAFGREEGERDGLILPHPRAADRLFVMGPIAEVAPQWRHPSNGRPAVELADLATIGRDARPLP